MPRFEPFPALRYRDADLDAVIAPPYDVLSEADVDALEARSPHNIVHVDVPRERDGDDRYRMAGDLLRRWVADGVMERDDRSSFTLYRMSFVDVVGRPRSIVGVLGGVEVEEYGVGGVLPHERITPKASTDRLDLTRATVANMSPVWGLSLAAGLTDLLQEPGELMGELVVDGVTHRVERVTDADRIAAISSAVSSDDVLIADGHHRYGVAQTYRTETRERTGRTDTPAEDTLMFVSELVADQLSVEAIHRVYRGISGDDLLAALDAVFDTTSSGPVTNETLAEMDARGSLCLVWPDGNGRWLTPKPGAFPGVRSLDGVWLEHVLDSTSADVGYQHGISELHELLASDPSITAAVLIRPVSVAEIERTAREGVVMPPKSTFFTPKLRTGLVVRPLD
ncbi:MAG: DUF1015 domain-containing protein [Ilumatobacteraceae bacterium]